MPPKISWKPYRGYICLTEEALAEIRLVYEDKHLLVLDKPEGICTIPNRQKEISLKDIATQRYGKVYVVHRLDKETSGLVIFARNPFTHSFLNRLFEKREVLKEYICVVIGRPEEEFLVDQPLRQFGSGRVAVDEKGKPAVTYFCTICRKDDYSVLRACPITGRRHQIRVHLYQKGFPILGDRLYGRPPQRVEGRLMLHAHRVEFLSHKRQLMSFVSPLPSIFLSYLDV